MSTQSPLRDLLRTNLLEARRARDSTSTTTLRSALAALENAEAVPQDELPSAGAIGAGAADAPRRTLTDAEEQEVLDLEIRALTEAAVQYDAVAPDRAAAARDAAALLQRCLASSGPQA